MSLATRIAEEINTVRDEITLNNSITTKAQFNALAEERKANRAGSGFDSLGWGSISVPSTDTIINEGMWVRSTVPNNIHLSRSENQNTGVSKSKIPIVNIDGVQHNIFDNGGDRATLPTAPNIYPYDTVLTAEQIASGVIKHADSSNSGLIVNGKFDTDTSGWTTIGTGTTFISTGGIGRLTTTSSFLHAKQVIGNLVIGKKYIVEFEILSGGGEAGVYIKNSSDVTYAGKSGTGKSQLEFTPTERSVAIWLYRNKAGIAEFNKIAVYPADAISRSDVVFLESWHEDISEKNFVYPLGNVQYLGGNTDGLTGIVNGSFSGFETYSLFGNWQTPSGLIGKGYVWRSLTEAQKRAFVANPENNCYLDGDKVIQVRYRVRVVQGLGDTGFVTYPYNTYFSIPGSGAIKPKGKQVSISSDLGLSDSLGIYGHGKTLWTANLPYANELGIFSATSSYGSTTGFLNGSYNGQCFALPIALVHRKNQGMYHNVYNPNGTKLASDGLDCFRTSVSFTSISDCFNPAKLLTESGYIGTVSGRPDELFYDQVHEGAIQDLRNSSKKVEDYNRLISREFNKLVAGTYRGKESNKEFNIAFTSSAGGNAYNITGSTLIIFTANNKGKYLHTNVSVGDKFFVSDGAGNIAVGMYTGGILASTDLTLSLLYNSGMTTGVVAQNGSKAFGYIVTSNHTKSNTLLHCDIIGNPANYPTAWKESGVFGTPLIVAEDGTSLLPDGTRDTFKLSRKANAEPVLGLRSTDNGATWTETGFAKGLGQTNRIWRGMTTLGTDVYTTVGGDIYKQTNGTGNFVALGQTSRDWHSMTILGTDIYCTAYAGDIYKQTNGTGDFLPLGQTNRAWRGMTTLGTDVYACVDGGDIYKQTNGAGDFLPLGQTNREWIGMATLGNDVYCSVLNGDIYKQTNGTGDFLPLGQTNRAWRGMTTLGTDVYATVNNGDIYKQTNGVGNFVALGQTSRAWYGMTTLGTDIYCCVSGGDIHKLPKDNFSYSSALNQIKFNTVPQANEIIALNYQTKTSMAVPVANSEVLEIGDVYYTASAYKDIGSDLLSNCINKVGITISHPSRGNAKVQNYNVYSKTLDINYTYAPVHSSLLLPTTSVPAVKVLPYLTRTNGKAYLNLVFKEMKYNGTSWGDDSKFNIASNVSTTLDNNAQTVLIGQKTVELPYFIGADE